MQPLSHIISQNPDTFIATAIRTIPSHSEKPWCLSSHTINSPGTSPDVPATGNIYTFDTCIGLLNRKGAELYGEQFRIYEEDHETLFKLLVYMTNDAPNAKRLGINLDKGILLSGPVGCGKTSLMQLVNYFRPQGSRYILRPCRDVGYEFIKDGYDTIHKYSRQSFTQRGTEYKARTYCFDDLGSENNLKYFGNDTNVMAEILLSRYDLFVAKGMYTHITTNLSADEIETCYGNRVRSRMRSMFNLIAFENGVKDKRM